MDSTHTQLDLIGVLFENRGAAHICLSGYDADVSEIAERSTRFARRTLTSPVHDRQFNTHFFDSSRRGARVCADRLVMF